jgi:predicted RNase H-like nuclease (RuvC/YqgF family)
VSILSLAAFEELKEQRRKEIELASDPAITLPRKPEKKLVHIEQLQASIESLKAKNAILRDEVLRLTQELAEFRKVERQAIFKDKAKR